MPELSDFFDEIDLARIARAKELSELKRSFGRMTDGDVYGIASKAIVVLAYANWEGFYNDCVRAYMQFLVKKGGKVRDFDWPLLVGAFHSDFQSIKDRNYSLESRQQFVEKLKTKIDCGFEAIDATIVEARSNLDFLRLAENYALLSFDLSKMQRVRNRLDKELVGWRHAVAHGDSPDLTSMDVDSHIDFASSLLILLADCFQYAMLDRV